MIPLTPRHFGAFCDGVRDDRAAIQSAVDWVVNSGGAVDFGDFEYAIDGPISVGARGYTQQGHFRLFGDNGWAVAGRRGAKLRLRGIGHSAVMRVESQPLYRFNIENLALVADQRDGAAFGLLFAGTKFTQPEISNVHCRQVDTAFGILGAGDGNGEFIHFHRPYCTDVRRFFYMDGESGQALRHMFVQPGGMPRLGGVLFEAGGRTMGTGGRVIEPNFSFVPYDVPGDWHAWMLANYTNLPQTTVLKLNDTSDPWTIDGGRIECASTLIDTHGGSWNQTTRNTIRDTIFDGMHSSPSRPVIKSDGGSSMYDFLIDRAHLRAMSFPGKAQWAVAPDRDCEDLFTFNRCEIDNFAGVAAAFADPVLSKQVKARECRVTDRRDDTSHASKPALVSN